MKTFAEKINRVKEIVTEAHKGQTRWDGTPYITHPLAVREIVINLPMLRSSPLKLFIFLTEIVALAHDAAEDTKISELEFITILEKEGILTEDFHKKIVYKALTTLNKNNYGSYLEFILAAKANRISRLVKIADITHNLRDLTKGSMKDKYLLALHILEN